MGHNVRTISEPEAAAIYCKRDMKDTLTLKVGDKFVVCDAGGGTVDIITFEVESIDGEMVKLKEAVAGDGHACGSVFLNRRFKKWLIANYQDHRGWESDTLEDAMEHFEQDVKRNFRKCRDKNIVRVTGLSDDPKKGIRRQKLSVQSDVMQTFFEPVISTITALVCAQLKAAKGATAVLLVGGFGQSYYLEESIRDVIGEDVALWKPRKGEEAVARGGLQISMAESSSETPKLQITSRIARKSYGIAFGHQFTPSDPSSKRYVFLHILETSH
jgi:molecular chaperone DnaK (HSP70)